MSVELTVAQLNQIHARIYELIKNAPVHDEAIESFGLTPEEFGNVWHKSEIKAYLYKEFAEALGLHQVDSEDFLRNELPNEVRQDLPETVSDIVTILSHNPFTSILEDIGGAPVIMDTASPQFRVKEKERLWKQISEQVIDELPALLTNPRSFTEQVGR